MAICKPELSDNTPGTYNIYFSQNAFSKSWAFVSYIQPSGNSCDRATLVHAQTIIA